MEKFLFHLPAYSRERAKEKRSNPFLPSVSHSLLLFAFSHIFCWTGKKVCTLCALRISYAMRKAVQWILFIVFTYFRGVNSVMAEIHNIEAIKSIIKSIIRQSKNANIDLRMKQAQALQKGCATAGTGDCLFQCCFVLIPILYSHLSDSQLKKIVQFNPLFRIVESQTRFAIEKDRRISRASSMKLPVLLKLPFHLSPTSHSLDWHLALSIFKRN